MSDQVTTDEKPKKKREKKAKPEAAPPQHLVRKPKTWHESLMVRLTAEELAAKGREAADVQEHIEELELQRKEAADDFKTKISVGEAKVRDALRAIRRGEEERPVEVVETWIYANNTAEIRRADNGELLRERALTAAELQPDLPLEHAPTERAPNAPTEAPPVDADGLPKVEGVNFNESYRQHATDSEPESGEEITAPEDILDNAADDEDGEG